MTDTTNKPGDTLEDNVRYLLSRCPWTVRDMSGERTGMRGKEDIAGSLAITWMKMEDRIRELERAAALERQVRATSKPVATIHVDGSFVHVEWHGKEPNVCHLPVYAEAK
jgi:hypothetical protein